MNSEVHFKDIDTGKCTCGKRWCDGCHYCNTQCECIRVEGVGPDAATTVNAQGGKQSASPYRLDLLPWRGCLAVSKVLKTGADKYGINNWRSIPQCDHLNHALAHIAAFFAGDSSDDHLEHAACRILFALETNDDLLKAA